ncbi:MAG TPA: branched-chain amino acid ABC transporter substrate-binding protein, partial [Alphaproteobacteria bacterium]|nr:branched-chain amino acid ABC transporter substrate-binding protein [Alphaproteobacteria bacterium]
YTYAAVQIFAKAATQAKSTKLSALLPVLHQTQFETVLGPIAFNVKGDVTTPAYKVYAWKDGKYDYAN